MSPIEAGLTIVRQVFTEVFTSPFSLAIYMLLFLIITWQYHRSSKNSGELRRSSWSFSLRSALLSTVFGMVGGLMGSVLLLWAGVDLNRIGIIPLWIAALIMMIISPRLLCFAYAGGLVGLLNLTTGHPDVSIPDLMALVAILHMIESLLIFLDGRFFPVPIYVKRGNRLCGGFNLQKFWPVLLIVAMPEMVVFSPQNPDWQAVLGSSLAGASLATVLAVLGYGEVSTAFYPAQKSIRSAVRLFGFSAVLLLLSLLSLRANLFLYLAVFFSPLGHEFIIWLGLREEMRHKPIFMNPQCGLMVLSTDFNSPAARCGLQSGDIILSVADLPIDNDIELQAALFQPHPLKMDGLRRGRPASWHIDSSEHHNRGIILVPEHNRHRYVLVPNQSFFNLLERMFTAVRTLMQRT